MIESFVSRVANTFLFDLDHQRYEALFQEILQVQETIPGWFNTCSWASNFDIDTFNEHWSPAIFPLVMWLQAHKLLASLWVFSFAHRMFKYWLIVIEQTAHNLGVPTLVSALEISDLPPVSLPASGVNCVITYSPPSIRLPMMTFELLLRFPLWRLTILPL